MHVEGGCVDRGGAGLRDVPPVAAERSKAGRTVPIFLAFFCEYTGTNALAIRFRGISGANFRGFGSVRIRRRVTRASNCGRCSYGNL